MSRHPGLVRGIGVADLGKFPKIVDGKRTRVYKQWEDMFKRCYSEKYQATKPAYIGCTVDPRFHNFQDFAAWAFDDPCSHLDDAELDKDILIKGNKVYSPDTCSFVPEEINALFRTNESIRGELPVGVHRQKGRFAVMVCFKSKREWLGRFPTPDLAFAAYKTRKEEIIKVLADEYRARISPAVYAAMMAREVLITD